MMLNELLSKLKWGLPTYLVVNASDGMRSAPPLFQCTVRLPAECGGLREVTGDAACASKNKAKEEAAVKTLRAMVALGMVPPPLNTSLYIP